MKYSSVQNVTKPVSRILYGTSSPFFAHGEDRGEFLDAVLDAGVTTFDTARVYGKAEEVLGNWMASRGNRDRVVLLSKGGHPSMLRMHRITEKAVKKDLKASLEALKTDYIDIYLLHRDDPRKPVDEMVEVLNELHAEGKIGAFGGSNWTHTRILEANEYAYRKNLLPFTVSSPYFGLADMKGDPFLNGAVSVAGPSHEEARAWYSGTGMALVAFSVLGRGFFSGRVKKASDMKGWVRRGFATADNFERLRRAQTLAAEKGCSASRIALAWMLRQDLNGFAVVSTSSMERMRDNLAALDLELSEEELAWLDLRGERKS